MTRRLFIKIAETGICNEAGRAAYTVGYGKRMLLDPFKPLTSLIELTFGTVEDFIGWNNEADAKKDFDSAVKLIEHLRTLVETKEPKP